MLIRQANATDLDTINAFDCFGGDRPDAVAAGRCLVAEDDGRVAGFVVYGLRGLIGKDFVEFLVVDEPFRRRGLAVALLRAVEQRLATGRLFISTEADNAPMLALLERDGWTPAGQIDGINESGHAERFFYRDATGGSL